MPSNNPIDQLIVEARHPEAQKNFYDRWESLGRHDMSTVGWVLYIGSFHRNSPYQLPPILTNVDDHRLILEVATFIICHTSLFVLGQNANLKLSNGQTILETMMDAVKVLTHLYTDEYPDTIAFFRQRLSEYSNPERAINILAQNISHTLNDGKTGFLLSQTREEEMSAESIAVGKVLAKIFLETNLDFSLAGLGTIFNCTPLIQLAPPIPNGTPR